MTSAPSFIPVPERSSATGDRLAALREAASAARDKQLEIQNLEERLKALASELNALYHETLPALMDAAGVDHVGLPQDGNAPAVDYKLRPFYSANIAAKWSDDKKQQAFDYLKSVDAADLIKTKVEVSLPKGNLELAKRIAAFATDNGAPVTLTESVHTQTLTSWLRELVETHHTRPPQADLDKIGATIGRIVKPQERKS